MEDDFRKKDDLKKREEDNLKKRKEKRKTPNKIKKILIPLKFRGKPFLGLAQLSKIFRSFIFGKFSVT